MKSFLKILKFSAPIGGFVLVLAGLLWAKIPLTFAVTDFRDILESIGSKTELENYQTNVHADAGSESGLKNIMSAIFFAIDLLKYVLGSIAVLMMIINALGMITAGKESEDQLTKQKAIIKYALMGLVMILIAEEAIRLGFYGTEGEFLRDEETAAEFAQGGGKVIEGLYNIVEVFMGSLAVLMIVYSGFQILVAGASDEAVTSAKKHIYLSAFGLVLIGISELVIKDIIFKNQGTEIDVARGRELIVGLTNFLASMIGTIGVLAFVYAGFLYIVNFGNDELTGKAKKIMWSAIAGIGLAAASFAIVSTVIPLEGAQ
jgi:hypothetical protein